MKKKIRIEEWLKRPEYFTQIKKLGSVTVQCAIFTDYSFLLQISGTPEHYFLYGKKNSALFLKEHFKTLCENYKIEIELLMETDSNDLKIRTNNSVLSTYLSETEREILNTMGSIGVFTMIDKKADLRFNSSFEETVFTALGYKTKNGVLYLR